MMADPQGYQGHPTGNVFDENEPISGMGHHEDVNTPNTCLCCGHVYYWREPLCICAQGGNYWMQDELRRVTCFFHAQEKIKDGLFGALSGDFSVPDGRPVFKPTRGENPVAPIVHGKNRRTGST